MTGRERDEAVGVDVGVARDLTSRSSMSEGRSKPLTPTKRPGRTRPGQILELAARLSQREWAVIETVNQLRLVTGYQLERLHFADLQGHSRSVVRWRVLKRLVDWCLLTPLPRRVGGSLRGSAQLVYALDSIGERLLQLQRNLGHRPGRIRRPSQPGERFVRHTTAVSELYVQLVEHSRTANVSVDVFLAEPAAWWADGAGGWLKPDAYMVLSTSDVTDEWWAEVDLATEAMPTMRGKLLAYLDFLHRGQLGSGGVMPRVVVTVPNDHRHQAVSAVAAALPEPAAELFTVSLFDSAAEELLKVLGSPS